MSNFSGVFLDIVAQKLQKVVRANQEQVQKETRMMILLQILALSENPAFRAALITALRSSNTIESVKEEIANPSFHIDSFESNPVNKPAVFTTPFNVSPAFSTAPTINSLPATTSTITDVIKLKVGPSLMAKIVYPIPIPIGSDID
jgi:hypothetical protein